MTIMVKLGGAKATGVIQQAKRAFIADTAAGVAKKTAKRNALLNGTLTVGNGVNAIINASQGHPYWGMAIGAVTGFIGTITGFNIKQLVEATKLKKQTSKAMNDIINNKDFMDIVNRCLRIKGKKEVTSEQILKLL